MDSKKKRIAGIVTTVIVVVLLVLVALITLSIILSQGKGYTSLFGNAYVAVQTDSMERDDYSEAPYNTYKVKGFKAKDLIRIRILSDDQKTTLKEGDVVTFYFMKDGNRELNTHRVIGMVYAELNGETVMTHYITQGDKPGAPTEQVTPNNIVGQYKGHRLAGLGRLVDFFHSPVGFFVCIVLPSLLIVAYFAVNLVLTVKSVKAVYKAEEKVSEKERMREELMRELREEGKIKEETPPEAPKPEENPPIQESQESQESSEGETK